MLLLNQLVRRVTGGLSSSSALSPAAVTLTVILFFLPTQLGRHFWPDWAHLAGLRSDYLSPTIYLVDLLILFLFFYLAVNYLLTALVSKLWPPLHLSPAQKSYLLLLTGLSLVGLISIYNAPNQAAAWWDLVKLIEFGLFGAAVGWFLVKPQVRKMMLFGFLLGSFLQALIALGQFINGGSLGLWILGERSFNDQTLGIAQAIIEGKLVLRSYGTLPHPNVLGFWMLVSSSLSLWLALKGGNYYSRFFFSLLTIVFSLALITSLSRLSMLLWLLVTGASVFYFYRPLAFAIGKRTALAVTALILAIGIVLAPPLASRFATLVDVDSQTIQKRVELSEIAANFWQEEPFSGIGLGNFVVKLSELPSRDYVRFLQPAHNLYLLVLSEVGIIGLLFLTSLLALALARVYRTKQWLLGLILVEVIVAGFFDHYFWTLQQGGLLFWSIIGGLYSAMVEPEVIPGPPPVRPS